MNKHILYKIEHVWLLYFTHKETYIYFNLKRVVNNCSFCWVMDSSHTSHQNKINKQIATFWRAPGRLGRYDYLWGRCRACKRLFKQISTQHSSHLTAGGLVYLGAKCFFLVFQYRTYIDGKIHFIWLDNYVFQIFKPAKMCGLLFQMVLE